MNRLVGVSIIIVSLGLSTICFGSIILFDLIH